MTAEIPRVNVDWKDIIFKLPTKDYWSYEDCEKVVADYLHMKIKSREDVGEWGGQTIVKFEDKAGKVITFDYGWGSCSGCDTLEGAGEAAACEMIYDVFFDCRLDAAGEEKVRDG